MAVLVVFDLDLEDDLKKIYEDSKDTIKYLDDLVKSIEKRVLDGTIGELEGFKIESKPGNRFVTPPGEKYLAKTLGEDKVFEKKFITLGKLEKLLSPKEMTDLIVNGYMDYKPDSKKVELV